jgi:membrane-associated phospholipid phosphatase
VAVAQRALRPVDILLLGYLGVVSVVAAVRAPVQPGCWWLLVAHGLFVLLLVLLAQPGLGPVGGALRELYPLLLLVGLYAELDVLSGPGTGRVYDATVQRWELTLFGSQTAMTWWQSVPSRFWSAVLHTAYFSYYFIILAPALYFAIRRDLGAVRHFVLVVMTVFVICYLAFLFFPVAGPYYFFPRPPDWFLDNLPARVVYSTLATGSSYGAAFPSSHVAAAVAAAIAAYRGSRQLGLALAVPTLLLTVGVVYCQMHYGVDALAGLMVGVAVAWTLRTVRGWEGPSPEVMAEPSQAEPGLATGRVRRGRDQRQATPGITRGSLDGISVGTTEP